MALYDIGDEVTYVPFGGGRRTCTVTAKDINKGKPCFDGDLADGTSVWGYDDQLIAVHRAALVGA